MEPNITNSLIEPITSLTTTIFKTLSLLVGGIFGLYFIFLAFKWLRERKAFTVIFEIRDLLKDIDHRLKTLEEQHLKKRAKKIKKKKK